MADIAQSLEDRIESIMAVLTAEKERVGQSEKGRLLAIAITHLETAKLYVKETENI